MFFALSEDHPMKNKGKLVEIYTGEEITTTY